MSSASASLWPLLSILAIKFTLCSFAAWCNNGLQRAPILDLHCTMYIVTAYSTIYSYLAPLWRLIELEPLFFTNFTWGSSSSTNDFKTKIPQPNKLCNYLTPASSGALVEQVQIAGTLFYIVILIQHLYGATQRFSGRPDPNQCNDYQKR